MSPVPGYHEEVKPKFRVGHISDIALICCLALLLFQALLYEAHLAIPTLQLVVVDCCSNLAARCQYSGFISAGETFQ